MARIKRTKEKYHRFNISTDRNEGEVILVRGGKNGIRAYLWAGRNTGQETGCVTVSGRSVLIRLAKTILAECGVR